MSMLFRVVFASACSSTHHKLALDALRHLRGPQADMWRDLFLKHYQAYLKGSKTPDTEFKDFKNHVLHVDEGFWGGAVAAAQKWYELLVAALRRQAWSEAVFAAGVLSHYYSDPLMPFHTGQTEEEGKVHRALEWSAACAYNELQLIIEKDLGYPALEVPAGADWLATMVRQGALVSHPHYHPLIDHYDLARGVKDPPAGLDQECRDRLARCLAHATVGIARILERAIADAKVRPPQVALSLETFLATLAIPIRWVTKKLADAAERAQVERIYAEVRQTGKAIAALPEDDKLVRRLHAAEVLHVPLAELDAQPARPSGQAHGDGAAPRVRRGRPSTKPYAPPPPSAISRPRKPPLFAAPAIPPEPAPLRLLPHSEKTARPPRGRTLKLPKLEPVADSGPRFYLRIDSPIEDAPSIGATTARRFEAIGVHTVAELLALDCDRGAGQLRHRRLDAAALRDMQNQAALVCRVPNLRGHDAQILVACGITDPATLAAMAPATLFTRISPFLATAAADRILRTSPKPDLEEVTDWIAWAQSVPTSQAA